ncbi:MAG: ferredoxin [Bacilli bacterium]|jgi:ferredoxin
MIKVKINTELCIGCGACHAIAPEVFAINDEGFAYVKNNDFDEKNKDDVLDAVESCPTNAIERKDK